MGHMNHRDSGLREMAINRVIGSIFTGLMYNNKQVL